MRQQHDPARLSITLVLRSSVREREQRLCARLCGQTVACSKNDATRLHTLLAHSSYSFEMSARFIFIKMERNFRSACVCLTSSKSTSNLPPSAANKYFGSGSSSAQLLVRGKCFFVSYLLSTDSLLRQLARECPRFVVCLRCNAAARGLIECLQRSRSVRKHPLTHPTSNRGARVADLMRKCVVDVDAAEFTMLARWQENTHMCIEIALYLTYYI